MQNKTNNLKSDKISGKQEDLLFKDVGDEEVDVLLKKMKRISLMMN